MSTIITVHSEKAFKEFLLPAINNSEYSIFINKDVFALSKDVEIVLEVMDKQWKIVKSEDYILTNNSSREDYFDQILKNKDLLSIELEDGKFLSVMVEETETTYSVFEKYALPSEGAITIGSNESNTISYNILNLISREHALIRKMGNSYIIEDRSRNGVFVNSKRIVGSKQLEFGDCINIFKLCIVYLGDFIAISSRVEDIRINKEQLVGIAIPEVERDPNEKSKPRKKIPFHRSPRQIPKVFDDTIEIEAPPNKRPEEKKPLAMLIGPSMTMALPMLLGCGLAIYSTKASGNSAGAFMYTGLITAVSSAFIGTIWTLVNLRFEKKRNSEESTHRFEAYGEYLIKCANEIKEKYEKNTANLNEMYIPADRCTGFNEHNASLWNRNIDHKDFLSHRLGMGDMPFQVKVNVPKERFSMISDSLAEKPRMISESYKILHDVPICVDLLSHRLIGVVGGNKKQGGISVMHNLVAQIAAANCYTDVKMAFVYDEAEDDTENWDYLKWFPHVWSEDKKTRYIARNKSEVGDVLYELTQSLRTRFENNDSYSNKKKLLKPQYVLFVASPELLEGELINKYIYELAEVSGLTTVFIVDNYEKLPNACDYIIQNDSDFSGMYSITDDIEERIKIRFDAITNTQLEYMARTLADIEVAESESGGDIPNALTFFDMFKINRLEELNVMDKWRKNRTYESMKAIIGEKAGGTPWYLDIHEKYHGPHGLIAGTTGSGKSETLQTYILSLAINFSPDDVGFFIIDYKGGGMANLFDGLPHMIGSISNLSGNQVKRAMVSIKSENRRRQRIFNEYGVNNINLYTRLYKNNEASIPVPHMFIIIDEFAELKREEPDFMRELISVAQVGRSLGVHLILATQKPSGTVDDNIWSNSKFRLCLRVQDRQDSNDMLHRPDAAYITQAGRCYMQVGNDELFELFQSGYSGATYDENSDNSKVDIARIISSTGKAALIGNRLKFKRKEAVKRNWIVSLINILKKVDGVTPAEYHELLKDSLRFEQFSSKVFTLLEKEGIDYPYSDYNANRIKDLVKAYVACDCKSITNIENQAEAILKYSVLMKSIRLPEKKEKTQLDAVVSYLNEIAVENGYTHNLQLWLPVLPEYLYLNELNDYRNCFDGKGWDREPSEWNIEVEIGRYDDPVNQAQDSITVNFSQNGHHAIVGTVVSGKSTFLQTLIYALVNKYTPEEINIYAIDFSAKMMSAFEDMPHVGGVIYENENDKLAKFFNMIMTIFEERKQLFRGGNYSQYVRVNGVVLPTVIIAIDNIANFRAKTNNLYDDILLQLSKDAVNYGIYLVVTGGGFGAMEIPSRMGDNLRTVICLEMSDKYQYSEALRVVHIDTLPETNVKGRGLARVGDQLLEFQTALAFEAPDDFTRLEEIQKLAKKMKEAWTGKTAKVIPEIPEKPVWEEFSVLEDTVKMAATDRFIPVGYNNTNASVYGINLAQNYCYLVSGKSRSGKTNMLKVIAASVLLRKERLVLIDYSGDFVRFAGVNNLSVIDDDKKLFQFFSELIPSIKERAAKKRELVQKGFSDEELFDEMKDFEKIHIVIANMGDFAEHVAHPVDAGEIKGFLENILDKGSMHNIFFYAAYNPDDVTKVAGIRVFDLFTRYKTGIHFGGNVAAQRILNYDYVPYSEQTKSLKAGIGMLPFSEDDSARKIIVPLLKG